MMLPKSFAVCAKVHKVSGTLQEPECLFAPTWEGSEVPRVLGSIILQLDITCGGKLPWGLGLSHHTPSSSVEDLQCPSA